MKRLSLSSRLAVILNSFVYVLIGLLLFTYPAFAGGFHEGDPGRQLSAADWESRIPLAIITVLFVIAVNVVGWYLLRRGEN